jgi:hypothetical protein
MYCKLSILFTVLFFNLSAQSPVNPVFIENSAQKAIHFNGSYNFMSNSLSNEFAGILFYGGYIDEETKTKEQARLNKMNSVGAFAHTEMIASNLWGKDSSRIKIGVVAGNYNYIGWQYSDDFFNLVFFGNKNYVGKVADLSKTSYSVNQFSKLGASFFLPKDKLTINIALVAGHAHAQGSYNNLSLFTHPDAAQIDIGVKGNSIFADTSKNSLKGIGGAIDLYFRAYEDNRNGFLNIYVVNAGLVNWNNSRQINFDTTYSYSGIEFNNLLNNSNFSTDLTAIQDSLLPETIFKNNTSLLPFFMGVDGRFAPFKSDDILIRYGVNTAAIPGYSIQTSLGVVYIYKQFTFSATGNYGGFGKFSGDISALYQNEKISAGIAVFQPQGFIMNSSSGKGVSLRISKNL